MSPSLTLTAADSECADAVRQYARRVSDRTSLQIRIEESAASAGIVFSDAPNEMTLCVEIARRPAPGGAQCEEWEVADEAAEGGDGAVRDSLAAHYVNAMTALAGNPEAARALLKKLKGVGEDASESSAQKTRRKSKSGQRKRRKRR